MTGNSRVAYRTDPVEVSLAELFGLCWRQRHLIIGLAVMGAILLLARALIRPPGYVATAVILPQVAPGGGSLMQGNSGLLGGQVVGGRRAQSLQLYVELFQSRELHAALIDVPFTFPADGGSRSGTLAELYGVQDVDQAARRDAVLAILEDAISAGASASSGLVHVQVRAPWRGLAERIAQHLVDLLGESSQEIRATETTAERRFVAGRLEAARRRLAGSETELKRFLERNRLFENSPGLIVEHERLKRRVELDQKLVLSLAGAFVQARINEARNTPAFTVIESPDGSGREEQIRLALVAAAGFILGGSLGLLLALIGERRSAHDGPAPERSPSADTPRALPAIAGSGD